MSEYMIDLQHSDDYLLLFFALVMGYVISAIRIGSFQLGFMVNLVYSSACAFTNKLLKWHETLLLNYKGQNIRYSMKIAIHILSILLLFSVGSFAQNEVTIDSADKKQAKIEKKAERKEKRIYERKSLTQHFRIGLTGAYADLNSTIRFEGSKGLFSTQVNFERHLGLEDRNMIIAGSFIYRITPRSGFGATFYRLYRQASTNLENDIVYEGDTLKKGLLVKGYFNTDVFTFGYLLSILKDQKSFMGAYFNLYLINVQAGIRSEVFEFDESTGLVTPLPNFGIIAAFQLKKWVGITGGIGVFALNTEGLNGAFVDFNVEVEFNPTKWLGLTVGYYFFDVTIGWPVEDFKAIINYNYTGPSVGIGFKF